MDATAVTQYGIEYQDEGVWRRWYASPNRAAAEREWGHVQAIRPGVPVRFVEVEVLRSSEHGA